MKTWIVARQEGDDLAVEVRAAAPYGDSGRTATESLTVPADAAGLAPLRDALAALLAAYGPRAQRRARRAAVACLAVAIGKGEELAEEDD